jgi:hypothetical protein
MHRKACAMYEFAVMEDGRLKVVIGTAWRRSSIWGILRQVREALYATGVDDKRLLPKGREREWVWRLDLGKRVKSAAPAQGRIPHAANNSFSTLRLARRSDNLGHVEPSVRITEQRIVAWASRGGAQRAIWGKERGLAPIRSRVLATRVGHHLCRAVAGAASVLNIWTAGGVNLSRMLGGFASAGLALLCQCRRRAITEKGAQLAMCPAQARGKTVHAFPPYKYTPYSVQRQVPSMQQAICVERGDAEVQRCRRQPRPVGNTAILTWFHASTCRRTT